MAVCRCSRPVADFVTAGVVGISCAAARDVRAAVACAAAVVGTVVAAAAFAFGVLVLLSLC